MSSGGCYETEGQMIEFSCTYCGRRFRVDDKRSGSRGRCPNCKSTIIVPEPRSQISGEQNPQSADIPSDAGPGYKLTLLDVQQEAEAPPPPEATSEPIEAYPDEFRDAMPGHVRRDDEPLPERRFPWPVDILLYPLSKSGLTVFFIVVGVPLFLRILVMFFGGITMAFPPALVLLVLMWAALVLTGLVLVFYAGWYVCESVRDSALGGIRAVETAGVAPGLAELLGRTFRLLVCMVVLGLPALLYGGNVGIDVVFWSLLALGVFVMPMAVLAMEMFDSIVTALNPLLLLGSICSTLFFYLGLQILFGLLWAPVVLAVVSMPFNRFTFFLSDRKSVV